MIELIEAVQEAIDETWATILLRNFATPKEVMKRILSCNGN